MTRYLLDTCILIFFMNAQTSKNPPSASLIDRLQSEQDNLHVSAITEFELYFGAENSARPERNRRAVRELLSRLKSVPFQSAEAAEAGKVRAELKQLGTPIGPYDTQIAGTARAHDMVLVTNNVREFERVSSLLVEDWTK